MPENEYINVDKNSLALDLETLSSNYKSLLTKYKQAVLDYVDNLNAQSSRPCAKYSADSKNIDQACYEDIWKKSGCPTTGKVSSGGTWAPNQTLNGLIYDSWLWATMTDALHRQGCYGTTEGNPYNLLGVGTNGRLYSCKGLTEWNVMNSDWTLVNDDLANDLGSVCTGNDGKLIVGSTNYGHVIYKDNWNDPKWKHLTNQPCCVTSVAMGQDGTLVGVGTDKILWSKPGANGKPSLNGNWSLTATPGEIIISICIAPDGSLFCVGSNGAIWKKNSYLNLASQNWQYMGNNTCCVKAITIAPDGTFIGVGMDNKIYTKDNYKDLSTAWKGPYSNPYTGNTSCCVVGVTTIVNTKYNGAKFNTSKSPNYNINAPLLTEVKGQAFWGTGESSPDNTSGKTLQECTARCASTPNCTGATFNLNDHERPYCLLRSGQSEPIPALRDDYAIIPKGKQLLKVVESLNYELNAVNKKLQNKIDQLYTVYGKQIEIRFDQNYSLISQYDHLNGERKKIDDMIKEYQTLEETENEMGLFITKNYYLFFIFFLVVFIAAIVLAMLSLDPSSSSVVTSNIANAVNSVKEVANEINPFYLMFGIILIFVVVHLYNQYVTSIYNNAPSFKSLGQMSVIYYVFIIVIIFVAITYFTKNSGTMNM